MYVTRMHEREGLKGCHDDLGVSGHYWSMWIACWGFKSWL